MTASSSSSAGPFFTQPGDISPAFGLAVHAVMHNIATADTWDVLDVTYENITDTIDAISRIYATNGWPWSDKERSWWAAELSSAVSA